MITEIIKVLQSDDFYNVGKSVEIAKGKFEYVASFTKGRRKIKRAWLSKKK